MVIDAVSGMLGWETSIKKAAQRICTFAGSIRAVQRMADRPGLSMSRYLVQRRAVEFV